MTSLPYLSPWFTARSFCNYLLAFHILTPADHPKLIGRRSFVLLTPNYCTVDVRCYVSSHMISGQDTPTQRVNDLPLRIAWTESPGFL